MSKDKTLCAWDRDQIKGDLPGYAALVKKARFVCERCGRAARKKKSLCRPLKLGQK